MKKQSRRSITLLLSIYVLYGLAQACGEYRVLFLESQGLTATDCGYALAGASLLAAIARPLAGALADKLRSCRVVYISAVTSWLALLALLLLTRHVRLANLSLCVGVIPLLEISNQVTYGMIEAGGVNAALLTPGLDFSLIRVCLSISYSVISFLYTPIVNRFGPLAPFACTILYLAALLALSGSLRRFETAPDSKEPDAPARENLGISRLFQNYYLVCFVILNFLMSLGTQTTNYQIYLLKALQMDVSLVGLAAGLRVLGEIAVMPLVPYIKRRISLPMLQAVAGGFCILQTVLSLVCKNPYIVLGVVVLKGIANGITLSTTAVYLRLMAPKGLDATTLSLSTATSSLGQVVISLLGGVVVDDFGIFALYRLTLFFLCLWIMLYFGSWAFGRYILKKAAPVPMFITKTRPEKISPAV